MLSPQVYWRINNLITTLTKKNNKTHTAELLELTKMYETNTKVFLIATLLNEIDFRDQRTTGHRDTQKVMFEVNFKYDNLKFLNYPHTDINHHFLFCDFRLTCSRKQSR